MTNGEDLGKWIDVIAKEISAAVTKTKRDLIGYNAGGNSASAYERIENHATCLPQAVYHFLQLTIH